MKFLDKYHDKIINIYIACTIKLETLVSGNFEEYGESTKGLLSVLTYSNVKMFRNPQTLITYFSCFANTINTVALLVYHVP